MAVGRFQVMATLQAARAFVLGKPLETAKSFGLNRAIFYAAAKKGFKVVKGARPPGEIILAKKPLPPEKVRQIQETFKAEEIGDELAYAVELEGRTYYTIGNEIQTERDFQKQIEKRFEGKFEDAWKEALEICRGYDQGVLLSQRYFYEVIYKPRRDELAKKWSEMVEGK
ncbi:MAG: hypothetical protein NUV68_04630 [Caldiserica bacterium]|jgi:hypothetical protein|nr:hypothetical protein [Caldisericota bacterium]MDH7562621.1 hypothetical protein [Caldisericota bacterium]